MIFCLPDVAEFILSTEVKFGVLLISALPGIFFFFLSDFSSPSPGSSSEPAGGVQLTNLCVSELGQTAHGQWRDPHLQVVLHGQKRRQRAGMMSHLCPESQNVT